MIIKDYYKTIELKHNKLNLIDSSLTGKPFERRNPFGQSSVAILTDSDFGLHVKESDEKSSSQHRSVGKKKSNDYTVCFKLLEQAKKEEYKIVT